MTRERARWIVLGLGLFIFAAGTWAWFSRGQDRIEAENRRLVEHEAQLQGKITVLEKELATAEAKASASSKVEKAPDANVGKPEDNKAWVAWRRRFSLFQHKTNLRSVWYTYHDAIARLNLPPEKQAALLNLLAARMEAPMDAVMAAQAQGITDPHEVAAARDQAKEEVTGELVDLIGQSDLDGLTNAQALRGSQDLISRNVGADFEMGGVPLSQDQQAGLAQVFVDADKQFPPINTMFPAPPAALAQLVDKDALMLDKASSVLTPEQMGIFKDYLNWNDQRMKVMVDSPK
jgi:hypothetical protein